MNLIYNQKLKHIHVFVSSMLFDALSRDVSVM